MSDERVDLEEKSFIIELPDYPDLLSEFVERTGLSPSHMSVLCGLAPGTIPSPLDGTHRPLPETIDKIAMGLNLPFREWDSLRGVCRLPAL